MYHSCDSVAVHRLIEVKRLTDQIKHYRIPQKKGISLMAESPRQHHCSDIPGWKMVCMCEFACCVCIQVAVKYKKGGDGTSV